jgi:signal transduction histidine kinase
MEITRKELSGMRELTDASIRLERSKADALARIAAWQKRCTADDLIEHDRLSVGDQLRKFRDTADVALARERHASTASVRAVEQEREDADDAKTDERKVNDLILQGERQRSDDAMVAQREEQRADGGDGKRRANTNATLDNERHRVDVAVTSLGEAQSALSSVGDEVERRGNVLAMVAHELRNPLAVIAINTEYFASQTAEGSDDRIAAQDTERAIARMQRLLFDLLDLARIEGGAFRVVKEPCDVVALSYEILTAYRPLFEKRGIAFTCVPPPSATVAWFDHDRVVQVISNLLANAMKFTPAHGSVTFRVEARAEALEFVVEDTGAGIEASLLPRVFSRFWQGDSAPGTGIGLGLYICEKIIDAHGGRVWVESERGKGTVFRFTLPLTDAAHPPRQ